ncbi:MAG: type II toxin-antitoxin system PemK/MazF family toxin [Longimicrobiales bacterium]
MTPDRARPRAGEPPTALRGEIWEVDLDPRKGREQAGIRPCLIVSNDGLNRSRFGTVIVCPITTTYRETFKWRPGLVPEDLRIADATWKAEPHWVETDQIVAIDRAERLLRHLATLTNREKSQEVDSWLRRLILPSPT